MIANYSPPPPHNLPWTDQFRNYTYEQAKRYRETPLAKTLPIAKPAPYIDPFRKLRIICDFDEVIAAMLPEWIACYNEDYVDTLDPFNVPTWDLTKLVKPGCGSKIYDYLKDEALYDFVKPIPKALESIRFLHGQGHKIIIATSSKLTPAGTKAKWLRNHGFIPYISRITECIDSDKSDIPGDVMIDDYQKNLEAFEGKHKILFGQAHNLGEKRFHRTESWAEVVRIIQEIANGVVHN